MGREAMCTCEWAGTTAEVHALLENDGLILRGGMRRKVARGDISEVAVRGDLLCFRVLKDYVSLTLGGEAAEKWSKALIAAPPTLAAKMGINPETRLVVLGGSAKKRSDELDEAIGRAGEIVPAHGDIVLMRVDSEQELDRALKEARSEWDRGVAVWVIYPKGAGQAIGEALVRETMRKQGLADTKVVSVSTTLTGLRFLKRKTG